MTQADRKNAVLRKTRLNRGVRPLAAVGRPSVRNCEALSKTRYNSVRISNFGLKFLQYILNILYFRIKQKKISIFSTQVTRLLRIGGTPHYLSNIFILPVLFSHKALLSRKFFFSRFSCQDTQNDVKRPEKLFRKNIPVCVCVCQSLGKFKLLYSRNHTADRAKIWCTPKTLELIHRLGFYDDLNFLALNSSL